MSKTTEEKIRVMQDSLKPGAVVESIRHIFIADGNWVKDCMPDWNWLIYDYRVTFPPRKLYVRKDSNGRLSDYHLFNKEDANDGLADGEKVIEFIEVLKV